jgi:hypothetical protein
MSRPPQPVRGAQLAFQELLTQVPAQGRRVLTRLKKLCLAGTLLYSALLIGSNWVLLAAHSKADRVSA